MDGWMDGSLLLSHVKWGQCQLKWNLHLNLAKGQIILLSLSLFCILIFWLILVFVFLRYVFGAVLLCVSSNHVEFLSSAFPLSHHQIILSVCVVFWQNYTFMWFRNVHGTLSFACSFLFCSTTATDRCLPNSSQSTQHFEKHQPISAVWGIPHLFSAKPQNQ